MIILAQKFVQCPDINGQSFHKVTYLEWGTKNPNKAVICVHGLARNAHDFDFLAQDLAEKGFWIICPDMVGRGQSDWLKNAEFYTYPQYISDIMTLIASLGISRLIWVGTSMGGLIGMMIASTFPQIISKMAINDIGPFIPKESLMRIGGYLGKVGSFANFAEAESYLRLVMEPFGIKKEEHWQHIFKYSLVKNDNGSYKLAYDPRIASAFWNNRGTQRNMQDIDLWEMWNLVKCPVLILRGEKSDLFLHDTARKMASKVGTKLVEFPDVGHAPMLIEKDQINVVLDWITTDQKIS